MNSLAGLREFQHRQTEPGDEGLFLTRDGRLSEGITSNIFLLSGDTLLTPSPDSHILAGITRNHILAHARSLGIQAKEESLGLCDLTDADAIFVTNSVRGLVPVRQVIDRHGKPIWQRDSTAHPLIQQFRSVTPFL